MFKHKSKFFFNDNQPDKPEKVKEKKVKKVKEPKPEKEVQNRSNRKGLSFYGEKINYFFKNWILVIVLVVVLVILILFIKGCSKNNTEKKPKTPTEINTTSPIIVDSISLNINEEVPTIQDFVKNYESVKTDNDSIVFEETNFDTNKYNSVGSYKVTIMINDKEYISRVVVVDKEPPVFAIKDVTINEGDYYTINDFVSSCSDNSGKECALNYEKTEYSKLTSPGTYTIGIIAADLSGNTAEVQRPKLTIIAKPTPTPTPKTKTCEYGSTQYNSEHVITYSLIKNNCPISFEYAKTYTYVTIPEQMAKKEVEKLKTEIENKNISMTIRFSYNVVPVSNNEGTGLIGYSAYVFADQMVKNTKGEYEKVKTVVKYDINPDGSRKYTINELGI